MTPLTSLRRGQARPSALAGRWYPGASARLAATVRALLDPPAAPLPLRRVRAIISPHAGHSYSGPMAGRAFAAARDRYTRVVLIGPAHRVVFRGVSAGDFSAYQVPTGDLPVDRAAIAALEAAGLVTCHPQAHAQEHCLEVLLPFVVEALGLLPILPLLAGDASAQAVATTLEATLRDDDLLVVSTDLSHFHPYEEAARRDRQTLDAIIAGRGDLIDGRDACGYRGIQGTLRLAERRGWARALLGYRSSGDTAGDRAAVVGYGALALGPPATTR